MFFSVGVETPKNDIEAYGLVVPALCNDHFACYSAADNQSDIAAMAREAIILVIEEMLASGHYGLEQVVDAGHLVYVNHPDYQDYDSWFVIEVDLSGFSGKQHRINITLPDILITRIDNRVKEIPATYRDRSHFLAEAARRELNRD